MSTTIRWASALIIASVVSTACGEPTPTQSVSTDQIVVDPCPYILPWRTAGDITVSQSISDPANLTHTPGSLMEYAVDFALPEGTPVLASRTGEVNRIHDGETAYGDAEYRNNANFVIVDHKDRAYTLYLHLQSVIVDEGDEVQQGELLGYSGKTGWTYGRPHLHFQVQNRGDGFGQSIPFCFSDVPGGIPQQGMVLAPADEIPEVGGEVSGQAITKPEPPTVKIGDFLFFATHLDLESDSVEDSWTEIYTASADGKDLSCLTCDLEEITLAPGTADLSPDRSMVAFSMATALEGRYISMIYVLEISTQKFWSVTYGTSPTWSPDGKRLAFYNLGEDDNIFLTDLKGNTACVTCEFNDQQGYFQVNTTEGISWSQDSRWIAFVANVDTAGQIYKISIDGKSWIRLTDNTYSSVVNPMWSPDGKFIAYSLTEGNLENLTINTWLMSPDGSGSKCLSCGIAHPAPGEVAYSTNLSWSPDGDLLLIATACSINPYQGGVFRPVLEATSVELYAATREGDISLITKPRLLSMTTGASYFIDAGFPVWSPDDKQIAFVGMVDESFEIFVMNSDGSNLRQITNTPAQHEHSPFWLR